MPDENAEPCGCGWLEREAGEPQSPVEFDARMNEYQIAWRDGGMSVIYHCPFCGGRAPRSLRGLHFAQITTDERERLVHLIGNLRTMEEVINALGQPDVDSHMSASTPEKGDTPPTVEVYREVRYRNLSPTANVRFTQMGDRLSVSFQGKYLEPPDKAQE